MSAPTSLITFWKLDGRGFAAIGEPALVHYACEVVDVLRAGQALSNCIKIMIDDVDLWVRPGMMVLG